MVAGMLASTAYAWSLVDGALISHLIQFESGIRRDYTLVKFSNGERCRIPHTDEELLALVGQ